MTDGTSRDVWREEKVAFVTGHKGGPFWEIVLIFAVIPALGCLLAHLVRAAAVSLQRSTNRPPQSLFQQTLVEWVCAYGPLILSMTTCADNLVGLVVALVAINAVLFVIVFSSHKVVCS